MNGDAQSWAAEGDLDSVDSPESQELQRAREGRQERLRMAETMAAQIAHDFRNLLSPLLSVAGYAVTTVETADRALELYEEGRDFDVILSDIELPGMNGFEFAQAVRSSERWADIPLIALSAYTSIDHLQRGHDVGFDDYVGKFDRDTLLRTLENMLYPELADIDES